MWSRTIPHELQLFFISIVIRRCCVVTLETLVDFRFKGFQHYSLFLMDSTQKGFPGASAAASCSLAPFEALSCSLLVLSSGEKILRAKPNSLWLPRKKPFEFLGGRTLSSPNRGQMRRIFAAPKKL